MLEGMCTFLGCSPDRDSIAKAVSQWDSEELDKAAAEAGVVYAIVRTPEEWAVTWHWRCCAGRATPRYGSGIWSTRRWRISGSRN